MGRKRRTVLAGGTSVLAALAGCSKLPDGVPGLRSQPVRARLLRVDIVSDHASQQSVDLLVQREGTIVHWDEHAVPGAGSDGGENGNGGTGIVVSSPTWPGCAESYHFSARLSGTRQWAQLAYPEEVSDSDKSDPHIIRVAVSSSGELSVTPWYVARSVDCDASS